MNLWRIFAVKFQAERLEPLNLNSVPTTFPKKQCPDDEAQSRAKNATWSTF
jgi:hypothetical protein